MSRCLDFQMILTCFCDCVWHRMDRAPDIHHNLQNIILLILLSYLHLYFYFWSLDRHRVSSANFFTQMEVCLGTRLSIPQGVRKCRQNNKRLGRKVFRNRSL